MGGLRKYMPITYVTMLIGSLALCGIPPFAGFFSKDAIIEAVHASTIPGHAYAYFAVVAGVFVTSFYSFRLIFMSFHGAERFRHAAPAHTILPICAHGRRTPRRAAEGKSVGRHGAADCAGDSVGLRRLDRDRAAASVTTGNSIVVLQQHAVLAELRGMARCCGVHRARRAGHSVLARDAGIVMTWYLYPSSRHC